MWGAVRMICLLQSLPQAPQLSESFPLTNISQPLPGLLSQSPYPGLHSNRQAPEEQLPAAFAAVLVQALPHAPQFRMSSLVLIQNTFPVSPLTLQIWVPLAHWLASLDSCIRYSTFTLTPLPGLLPATQFAPVRSSMLMGTLPNLIARGPLSTDFCRGCRGSRI